MCVTVCVCVAALNRLQLAAFSSSSSYFKLWPVFSSALMNLHHRKWLNAGVRRVAGEEEEERGKSRLEKPRQ